MMNKIPDELEKELLTVAEDSYRQGVLVRRGNILKIGVAMAILIIVLANLDGVSDTTALSIIISVSSLSVVWGVLSMSASLNMQSDILSRLYVHYSESLKTQHTASKQNEQELT